MVWHCMLRIILDAAYQALPCVTCKAELACKAELTFEER